MKKSHLQTLRCPKCHKKLYISETNEVLDDVDEGTITCEKGHSWKISDSIPSLVHPPISEKDQKWITEYDEMAEKYDELVLQYNDWLGIDMMQEREQLSQFVSIEGPERIIDVSIGTAANFMALDNQFKGKMGRFNLHGLDLSRGMLMVSKRKIQERGLEVSLVHGSVFNIPYESDFFDVVIHSGGVNTFSDIPGALEEMLRVARPEGFVIVIDEGISPEVRATERGQKIIEANALFAAKPPIEHVPDKARDLQVTYVMNGTFYQMVFRK